MTALDELATITAGAAAAPEQDGPGASGEVRAG
jgi:hypothetical protein